MTAGNLPAPSDPVLITGGAGFVGTNLADRLAGSGARVVIYDDLSRPGVADNLAWLRARHGAGIRAEIADVRDGARLAEAVREAGTVYHLAAQVAVTTSLRDPLADFAVNCASTVALLDAARRMRRPPAVVFTSTNKVYGGLDDVAVHSAGRRCEPFDAHLRENGVDEHRPLDFVSPYGCSKGAADQYVIDWCRSYGVPGAVLRMSCIYGPHQRGTEDQGWVAHFLIRALTGAPITLFGDGRQVRDVLYVGDLVELLVAAGAPGSPLIGRAVNVGGGAGNSVSLLEVLTTIGALVGRMPEVRHGPARPGDQRWYVSDVGLARALTGWQPRTGVREGLERLHRWLVETPGALAAAPARVAMA
jgi:CDP-paratose 2-epimerase